MCAASAVAGLQQASTNSIAHIAQRPSYDEDGRPDVSVTLGETEQGGLNRSLAYFTCIEKNTGCIGKTKVCLGLFGTGRIENRIWFELFGPCYCPDDKN
jgi:hypothetical protein